MENLIQTITFFSMHGVQIKYSFNSAKGIIAYEKNLYADKNYYFITVAETNGKRIVTDAVVPGSLPVVNSFENFPYHEVDQYSILTSGREWFGERFDITTEMTFDADIQNIIPGSTLKFVSAVKAQSNFVTTFNVSVNNTLVITQNIAAIDAGQTYRIKGAIRNDTIEISASSIAPFPGPRRRDQPGFRIPAVPGAMVYDPHRRILWIGTKVGLYMLDSAALNAPLEPRLMDVYELSSIVMSVALDGNGSFWVHDAVRLSLTIIDPDERTVRQEHLPQNTDPYSVCAAMVVDASGAAWLGTSDERLYHRSPESTTWQTIAHGLDAPWSLGNTMVHALLCDATGTVWIGTEDGLVRSVATMPDQRLLCSWRVPITVNSMEYDGKRLYIATHGAGLVIMDTQSPDQRDTLRYTERKGKYDPSAPPLERPGH